MRIQGKVVLITGASEGIGAACAASFRKRGAKLSLIARSEDKLRTVAGEDALVTVGDITSEGVREDVVKRTVERFGAVDILINNAGIGLYAPAHQVPMAEARRMFELNLFSVLHLTQLVAPLMKSQRSGCIVNVGSIAGKITLPWFTLYSVSKYAIGSLTDGLRMELKPFGVHAMTVCPGYVHTAFQAHVLAGTPPPQVVRGRRFTITAEQCAEAIAAGVERNARTVMTPRMGWLLIAAQRLMPGIVDGFLMRMNREYRQS